MNENTTKMIAQALADKKVKRADAKEATNARRAANRIAVAKKKKERKNRKKKNKGDKEKVKLVASLL